MYGYEPPEGDQEGSLKEVLGITREVFRVLVPVFAALLGAVGLLIAAVLLYGMHPALTLIPLAIAGAGLYWMIRRDRRRHAEDEARLNRPGQR